MRTDLKIWLIDNNLKAGVVAKELGITASYFSQIVSGAKNPSVELLERFHNLYGDKVDDIFKLFRKR